MSLKEELAGVKEQLNAEEQFLENAIITERFVKRYKNLIFGAIGAVIVVVIGGTLYQNQLQSKKESANEAFLVLQKDVTNTEKKAELLALNPKMYDLILLQEALKNSDVKALGELTNSSDSIIADIAKYQKASIDKNLGELESYAMTQNALYKDYALLNTALLMMQKGDIDNAHQKLSVISTTSPVYTVAQSYLHYGIK